MKKRVNNSHNKQQQQQQKQTHQQCHKSLITNDITWDLPISPISRLLLNDLESSIHLLHTYLLVCSTSPDENPSHLHCREVCDMSSLKDQTDIRRILWNLDFIREIVSREHLQHISFMAQRYRNVWILSCCILKTISTHRREIQWIITSMYLKQWMLSIHNLEIKQISKMNRWKQDSACALLRVHVQRCYRSLVISRPQITNDKPGEIGDHATIRCSKWKPPVHSFVKPPRISSMLKRGILSLLHQEITKVT